MRYLLDTCICVELVRQRAAQLLPRFRRLPDGAVGISVVTLAELEYGAAKSTNPARQAVLLRDFCLPLTIFAFDASAAETYGVVRVQLEAAGRPIGAMDLLIAAHAVALDATLITNNEREFRRVAGLRVENWLRM